MKTILKTTTLLLLLSFTFSCNKDDTNEPQPVLVTNVYAVGSEGGIVTIWKNGIARPLTNGVGSAYAMSVYVTDSGDEYVAGMDGNRAVLWINGIKTQLSQRPSSSNSVFVSGNDVYVVGYEENSNDIKIATLWKNGIKRNLSTNAIRSSDA